MKKPFTYVVPVALGAFLSACSSTQTLTQEAQTSALPSTTNSNSTATDSKLTKVVDANALLNQELLRLRQELAQNAAKMVKLTKDLDEKDKKLSAIESSQGQNTLLAEIRKLQLDRQELERRYQQLRVENDQLVAQIKKLEAEKLAATAQATQSENNFIQLNKNFRTLDSAHFAMSKEFRELSEKHAKLKKDLELQTAQNRALKSEYAQLKQENSKLGGALSEARAQHQVLWDKIRVQNTVIDSLQTKNAELNRSGLITASDKSDADNSALQAEIDRLKAELTAQNGMIANYQSDVAKLEAALKAQNPNVSADALALEQRYQALMAENDKLTQKLAELNSPISDQQEKIAQLEAALSQSADEKAKLSAELDGLRSNSEMSSEQLTKLESQVNNLIPFEGAVLSLQQQLKSELTNVRWTLPTSANLNDSFEIQLTANVDNPIQGQTYFAELFVDSALQMMSSAEAESTVNQGQLSFRWRLSGLNERPNAAMNVAITQKVNYDGQDILRKVYRDTHTVELVSNDWLSKYGFWGGAILAGLVLGFGLGKLGRKETQERV